MVRAFLLWSTITSAHKILCRSHCQVTLCITAKRRRKMFLQVSWANPLNSHSKPSVRLSPSAQRLRRSRARSALSNARGPKRIGCILGSLLAKCISLESCTMYRNYWQLKGSQSSVLRQARVKFSAQTNVEHNQRTCQCQPNVYQRILVRIDA